VHNNNYKDVKLNRMSCLCVHIAVDKRRVLLKRQRSYSCGDLSPTDTEKDGEEDDVTACDARQKHTVIITQDGSNLDKLIEGSQVPSYYYYNCVLCNYCSC